jgi:hypothetical protein
LRDTAFLSIRESVKNFLIDDFLKYKQRNNNTVMKYLYTNTLTGLVKIIFFHFSLVSLSLDVWFLVQLAFTVFVLMQFCEVELAFAAFVFPHNCDVELAFSLHLFCFVFVMLNLS